MSDWQHSVWAIPGNSLTTHNVLKYLNRSLTGEIYQLLYRPIPVPLYPFKRELAIPSKNTLFMLFSIYAHRSKVKCFWMCFGSESIEQSIHEIHRLVFLSVDDFSIDLRHLHVRMSEQFRGRIKVGSERQHHRRECMSCGVK